MADSKAKKRASSTTKKSAKTKTKPTRSSKAAKAKADKGAVAVDRRRNDRRKKTTTADESNQATPEKPKLERRAKVNRRRQIDPTTCERDYTNDEIEFMRALDDYKRNNGRQFPTCSEILEVIRDLGYVKRPTVSAFAIAAEPSADESQPTSEQQSDSDQELDSEQTGQPAAARYQLALPSCCHDHGGSQLRAAVNPFAAQIGLAPAIRPPYSPRRSRLHFPVKRRQQTTSLASFDVSQMPSLGFARGCTEAARSCSQSARNRADQSVGRARERNLPRRTVLSG